MGSAGFDAQHVADLSMSAADDSQIIEYALMQGYTCITLDADFQAIVALSGKSEPSVIRFRIEGLKAPDYMRILTNLVPAIQDDLVGGAFISIQESGVRVRRLPV